jgi:hypothetical protein
MNPILKNVVPNTDWHALVTGNLAERCFSKALVKNLWSMTKVMGLKTIMCRKGSQIESLVWLERLRSIYTHERNHSGVCGTAPSLT